MSKRTDRIAAAKARPKNVTMAMRAFERTPVEPSKFARFAPVFDKRTLRELKRKHGL